MHLKKAGETDILFQLPYFTVQSKLNKSIRTTKDYWQKIVTVKHPILKGKIKQAKQALKDPDIIRQSKSDKNVYLYYRKENNHYICVVVRHENGEGFIITVYITSVIKEGNIIWQKKL